MQIELDVGQTYCITRSCQGALVYEIEIWTFFTLTLLYVYVAHSYSLVQRHSFKPQSLCAFAYFTQREFWRWSEKVKLLLFCMASTKTRRSNFGLKMSGLKFYLTLCPGIWSCSFSSCFFVEQASDNLLKSPRVRHIRLELRYFSGACIKNVRRSFCLFDPFPHRTQN